MVAVEGHRQAARGRRDPRHRAGRVLPLHGIGPNEVTDDEEAAARDEARRIKEDAK
jgi:hypothetical protein